MSYYFLTVIKLAGMHERWIKSNTQSFEKAKDNNFSANYSFTNKAEDVLI